LEEQFDRAAEEAERSITVTSPRFEPKASNEPIGYSEPKSLEKYSQTKNPHRDPNKAGSAYVIMGEHIFQQTKARRALALVKRVRPGEPSIDAISLAEQRWLVSAFDLLKQIDQQRMKGRPSANAFCIFEAGDIYVQFIAPLDSNQLLFEAVSAQSNPEITKVLTSEKEKLLFRFGFEPVGVSPNYSQRIDINNDDDLACAARLAFRVLKEVYQVGDFDSARFKLRIPNVVLN
jgi:hypothetical protein